MKLRLIHESNEFKLRVKNAILGKGKTTRMGLFGIVDEFGVSLDTAHKYARVVGGGTYGESDIEDKTLHRIRAPQAIKKLLKYYNVDPAVSRKLMRFHIDNYKIISKHQTSPPNKVGFEQLYNGERLVAIDSAKKPKIPSGYVSINHKNLYYVASAENEDIIRAIIKSRGLETDLLHGLAFGYSLKDVFNFIRQHDKELVDSIVGNVDKFDR